MVLWEGENWGWLLAIIGILSCGRGCSPFIITDDNESKINVRRRRVIGNRSCPEEKQSGRLGCIQLYHSIDSPSICCSHRTHPLANHCNSRTYARTGPCNRTKTSSTQLQLPQLSSRLLLPFTTNFRTPDPFSYLSEEIPLGFSSVKRGNVLPFCLWLPGEDFCPCECVCASGGYWHLVFRTRIWFGTCC